MAGYHVENFGCRASRSDGEAIASQLRKLGLEQDSGPATADTIIVNTCSVTAEADRAARAFIRRTYRNNPEARIVVTGCYAQRAPAELAALDGVVAVVGNSHKSLTPVIAAGSFVPASALTAVPVWVDESFAHSELATLPFSSDAGLTRPNLKVQDGCGNRCSFCVIPETRGPSRSVPRASALESVRRFVEGGGQELVLSGINLGRWGRDFLPPQRFEELVAAILDETRLPRLRISSVEPMDWTPELLALFHRYGQDDRTDGPRLARHAHLPLQSGSDAILRRMHRRYRPWHYAEKLARIREAMPEAAIGADVMVGFPSETDALFQESYDFIAGQPLTYLHLFPFSARPGTSAYELHRQQPTPQRAVSERMAALRDLIAGKNRVFRANFAGQELPALTLKGPSATTTPALTDNFLKLELDGMLPSNRPVRARIKYVTDEGLRGTASV